MTKILWADYFWPTMKQDCLEFMKKYYNCQRLRELKHTPSEQLHCSETSWPFHKWGIDIVSPFPLTTRQLKYLVVANDYFTKWVKVEPLPTITTDKVRKFPVTWSMIMEHSSPIGDLKTSIGNWESFRCPHQWSTPKTNRLAKAANKIIIARLKKRLEQAKGLWANELHAVLWAYHTTPYSPTKETLYRLVYGSDTIILIELTEPSLRKTTMTKESN